ncbi:condensation domain-containing protein, partial [Streptomyces sp. NPDC050535]|uniref:condensation domain-containing protein n=1 Tax=Streptomyces sp. NPDC050535 TaxID=3365626 RepID=UPI0037ADA2E5
MSNVENIYKLTSLQSGMLFHVLYESADVNPYVAQSCDEFVGPLDASRLRDAWQAVVDRHTALRSAFVWEGLDEPVQVVQRQVEVPFEELDWRGCLADEQETRLQELLREDRLRGFDLAAAPLLRFTVARLADERSVVLWSFHHLLLDGWSAQLVQKEVYAHYRASLSDGSPQLETPVPYARHIEWLSKQSRSEAETFWRDTLRNFEAPTGFGVDRATGDVGYGDITVNFDTELSVQLKEFARAHRVTVNTVVQGAWALLLSRYSGSDDIVYGCTVSGRPAELPGAESIVGLLINTLPVRVRIRQDACVDEWLRDLQEHQVWLRQYEYSALADIQGWSGMVKGEPLFRSIFVFQNYPKALESSDLPEGLEVGAPGGGPPPPTTPPPAPPHPPKKPSAGVYIEPAGLVR